MVKLFANSGDPDQMPCSVASDLGLHCLLVTYLGVSSLQCLKIYSGMANSALFAYAISLQNLRIFTVYQKYCSSSTKK